MFSKPSTRRKSKGSQIGLNLIPILDALICLVIFLVYSAAFVAVVVIDTPAPLLAPANEQVKKLKKKPLQLTAHIKQNRIILSDWTGSREVHTIPNVEDPETGELRYDFERLHQILIEVKQRHPDERSLILKPVPGVSYEMLVGIIDAARSIMDTDPPLYKKNPDGIDEPEKDLFPEVIFGNIMS